MNLTIKEKNEIQKMLDEVLFDEITVRELMKNIYNVAMEDRLVAKECFLVIRNKFKDDDSLPGELTFMTQLTEYMKLLDKSNKQLLQLISTVEKIISNVPGSGEDSLSEDDLELTESEKLDLLGD